jgi:hypothetical protein
VHDHTCAGCNAKVASRVDDGNAELSTTLRYHGNREIFYTESYYALYVHSRVMLRSRFLMYQHVAPGLATTRYTPFDRAWSKRRTTCASSWRLLTRGRHGNSGVRLPPGPWRLPVIDSLHHPLQEAPDLLGAFYRTPGKGNLCRVSGLEAPSK